MPEKKTPATLRDGRFAFDPGEVAQAGIGILVPEVGLEPTRF